MKVLTIIVPSYDMEKLLPRCLGSLVVSSELMNLLEVLVVNDGSKDQTSAIARGFADDYPQTFKVIDKLNGHYGSCINRGLAEASAVFVKVLDADDYFNTSEFEAYLRELAKIVGPGREAPDLVLADYDLVDSVRGVSSRQRFAWECNRQLEMVDRISSFVLVPMHAMAYRTELLRGIGYRQSEGIMYTDAEWTTYSIPYVRKFVYLPFDVYAYVIGREGQSVATDVSLKNGVMKVRIASRLYAATRDEGLPEKCRSFYLSVLERFAPTPFVACIRHAGLSEVNAVISALDAAAAEESEGFYDWLDQASIPRRKGIRYLHAWRKSRRFSWVMILWLRLIFAAAPKLSRLRSLVKS